jgi:L-aspartate oxidase
MTNGDLSPVMSDVLVIGSGIAGASAAIEAARLGLSVVIISKEEMMSESATWYAQGGIAGLGADDSPELLASDIIKAGDSYCYDEAVRVVSEDGPGLIHEFLIKSLGAEFDRNETGEIDLTKEGAHSKRRIFHQKDSTGQEIEARLYEALKSEKNIAIFSLHQAIDLISFPHHSRNFARIYEDDFCCGAYVLDLRSGDVRNFFARKVILATGGVGQVYLHTTNPKCATGDGIAMAYRAHADIINAEYVQFHPTALLSMDDERFLISEALRGEGARLRNRKGELFMQRYSPEYADLAPRDVVARAIVEEMTKYGDNYVLLDIASFWKNKTMSLKERFPKIYSRCEKQGIDITRESIPVVPVAHYFCGGIKTDLWGRTTLKNLHAVGETCCNGVHGANRLASISLLEGMAWGIRSARKIGEELSENRSPMPHDEVPRWEMPAGGEIDPILISQDALSIKTTMWNYAGIVRTQKRLNRALADMNYLQYRIMDFYKESALTRGLIELRNMIIVARLIIESALRNKKSQGCHYLKAE